MKNIRIAVKVALSLLILLVLGFIGLVIYAKYSYNPDHCCPVKIERSSLKLLKHS